MLTPVQSLGYAFAFVCIGFLALAALCWWPGLIVERFRYPCSLACLAASLLFIVLALAVEWASAGSVGH